jgi:hypothetical protein
MTAGSAQPNPSDISMLGVRSSITAYGRVPCMGTNKEARSAASTPGVSPLADEQEEQAQGEKHPIPAAAREEGKALEGLREGQDNSSAANSKSPSLNPGDTFTFDGDAEGASPPAPAAVT